MMYYKLNQPHLFKVEHLQCIITQTQHKLSLMLKLTQPTQILLEVIFVETFPGMDLIGLLQVKIIQIQIIL